LLIKGKYPQYLDSFMQRGEESTNGEKNTDDLLNHHGIEPPDGDPVDSYDDPAKYFN